MKICVGIDAAKTTHWAEAVDDGEKIVLDRAVENDPGGLDDLIAALRALGGEVVVSIDVVGSFARSPEATLLAEGFALVHTPGIAVNRAGQGFSGDERKSDPRHARTIAELVRTRALRPILADADTIVALRLKVGRRRDLTQDQTRHLTRLLGLLFCGFPGLEQTLDVTCKGPRALLTRFVTPAEIGGAGKDRLIAHLKKIPNLRGLEALACGALEAAHAQRIAVPGEDATAELIRELAIEALEARQKIARTGWDLEALRRRVTVFWNILRRRETFSPH